MVWRKTDSYTTTLKQDLKDKIHIFKIENYLKTQFQK